VREFVRVEIVGTTAEFGREAGSDEAARGERGGAGISMPPFDEIVHRRCAYCAQGYWDAELV